MSHNARVDVMFAAISVSYRARVGDVDQMAVDDMITRAEELLGSDDPIARACTEFATMYDLHWREPEMLKQLGVKLGRAIEALSTPLPPGLDRVDIYG